MASKLTFAASAAIPIAAALAERQPALLALCSAGLLLFVLAQATRRTVFAYAACAATFVPASLLFSALLPDTYSYLASATLLTVLAERISLEGALELAVGAGGTDREAHLRAQELSRRHARTLWLVVAGVALGAAASYSISLLGPGGLAVFASAVILLAAIRVLSERTRERVPKAEDGSEAGRGL